ncbi:class I SAM-dependent methyltransferase [Salibacterium halotolerans]|uniref:Methyltransferase domain-containing protein n=1 Tax=Salibacterium halotolerans TaxID=1884432 RepID=A0A1I5XQS8_9BACI|nr:class I SAM-dependent methyltransferase [Salibacterium halotolerans]SFQ34304.1 Methyltransferase domain-containing protein [Salibacterium halotolerans]
MEQKKLINKFDKQADKHAKRRDKQYDGKFRKSLYSNATGETLEVAVGAGNNFAYYPQSVHVTAVDFSPKMLEKAKEAASRYQMETNFILSAVEDLDFPPESFDTIVSTGTLCSYEDPVYVLNLFNRWCKPNGQILLMEHGISSFPPIAWLQKSLDPLAVRAIGCHQNRDIKEIVGVSNIRIKKVKRAMIGYLYLIWAKPEKEVEPIDV